MLKGRRQNMQENIQHFRSNFKMEIIKICIFILISILKNLLRIISLKFFGYKKAILCFMSF